ncbi:MFS transporter [Amycolatopsis sp. cg5]|uniref:MFS transporter n=1 Tax=Amycolatopsis sp. cg5 TaxID=3238802 RepID=UPI003523485D
MRGWNIGLIVLGQSSQSLVFGGISLFLPLIRADLGLTFSQAGNLAAVSMLVYALMQVPSGWLTDRFDPKRLFCVGLLGTNAMSLLFSVIGSYGWLLVVQVLSGFFRALIFAPGMVLIRDQFPPNRRATAMGLYVAGGFSSSVLLNALGPVLVGPLGWQGLFVLFGGIGLACVALYFRVGVSPHREPGTHPRAAEIRRLFRHPALWLVGVIQFVRLSLVQGFTFWLPSYLVSEKGQTLAFAGAVAAAGALLTAPSNLLGGWLSDRLHRPLTVIAVSLTMLGLSLAVLPLVDGLVPLVLLVGVNALFIQLYFGPLFSVGLTYLGQRTAGFSSGFGNSCANLGGFAFTAVLGGLKDSTGSFTTGFSILAGLAGVALVAVFLLRRTTPLEDVVVGTG